MLAPGAYLSALFAPALKGGAQGLLTAGLAAPSVLASKADAIRSLGQAEANKDKRIAGTARQPQVQREIAAFRSGVAKAGSVSALLSDPTVMKVLLGANGLGDQAAYPALARKALMSDPADSKALVNTLSDKRWKSVAQTYRFASAGLDVLRDPKVMDTIAQGYAEVTWRKSLDQTTPGLSDALSFREQAGKVGSVLQILGDPVLRRVVTTTLGLPLEIAVQSLDAQQKAIGSRLDVARLHDPKFVETFAQRYLLAMADKAAADPGTIQTLSPGLLA